MDINLKTDIAGYFSYKIYRDTPENIIYESAQQKNLIVDSGLRHLYSISVPDAMRILDLGNSNIPAAPEDTKLKGASFNNSSIFNDLSAIYLTGGYIADDLSSEYTAFFRTKTTSSPTVLKEFVIKPGPNQSAFARQVFNPITLQAGDGIEFTYQVKINWECASSDAKLKLYYSKIVNGEVNILEDNQLPLNWTSVRANSVDKLWTNISYGNNNVVAIAYARNNANAGISNIEYSTNLGVSWLSADSPADAAYDIDAPLNDIAFGNIINNAGVYTPKFVTVGLSALYTSNTGAVWLSGNVLPNDWTSIAYGTPLNGPLFVAVSNSGSNRVVKSSDTINWTTVNSSITNSINWSAITYGKRYVAVAPSGPYRIAYSTDGQSWLSAAAPALNEWCDIAYSFERDLYVAVSRNDAAYSPIMYAFGEDLTKWYPSRPGFVASWHGITYGNGIFLAVGGSESQSRAIYSIDGIDWFPISFVSFNETLKSAVFANNTFIAVASSTGNISEPFARSEVLPRTGGLYEIDSKIARLSVNDRVYNQESYMYTLRDFDMPVGCSVSPATADELFYSTTLPYNSYVKATTNLISPNTAVSIYKFDNTAGHGAIKNLLITNNVLLTGYKTPGLWAIELNADPQLSESIVYTGTLDNIVTLTPEAGSITRSISSTTGDITDNILQFNVYHTWGSSRPVLFDTVSDITITDTVSSTAAIETRPYIDIIIPTWTVINTDDHSNKYYSQHVSSTVGIFPNSFDKTGISCTGSSFTVENALIFELKSNNISTLGKDTMAKVYKSSVRSNYRYTADNIITELQSVTNTTSAQTVSIFNANQITRTELFNDVIASVRACGITINFIDDVILAQVNGKAVIRIIFEKASGNVPDYAIVSTQTIDNIDGSCIDTIGNPYLGPGQSADITRYSTIKPI